MTETDPFANDPFFRFVPCADWNACIGRQGYEENYLDGYIEAAIELVNVIIEKNLLDKRDTLVLPILYNARHAIELTLKFVTDRLLDCALLKNDGIKRNHDINIYWERLHEADLGDETLRTTITELKPFVESVSRIDADGQELRYHRNRKNDASLAEYSTANLMLIQRSLRELEELLGRLQHRSKDMVDECKTGAFTARCSRRDLFEIARLLPQRTKWSTQEFLEVQQILKARFNLSNTQFSKAMRAIQDNREMAAIVGIETDLIHLSDAEVIWIVEQWRRIHPKRSERDFETPGLDYFDRARFEEMAQRLSLFNEVILEVKNRLSAESIADLEAIFYLQRDGILTEYYAHLVAQARREHDAAVDPDQKIRHLLEKTNLLSSLQHGVAKLGRLNLAECLRSM